MFVSASKQSCSSMSQQRLRQAWSRGVMRLPHLDPILDCECIFMARPMLGRMNAAMQSLTDSTHWPTFASEEKFKLTTASHTPPVPISRLALLDESSEASSNGLLVIYLQCMQDVSGSGLIVLSSMSLRLSTDKFWPDPGLKQAH